MAIPAFTSGDVYQIGGAVSIDFTQVDASTAVSNNTVGACVLTNKGPALYALVGSGGVVAGSYVAFTQNITTGLMTATIETTTSSGANPRQGGIALAPASAGQYAWFLTGPFDLVPVNVANSVASGAALTTTATGGQLGAGGDTVVSMYTLEASGASGLTACSAVQQIGSNI